MNLLINVTDSFKENFQLINSCFRSYQNVGALRDLVPSVHFKKRETATEECFLYCTNGTKLHKTS